MQMRVLTDIKHAQIRQINKFVWQRSIEKIAGKPKFPQIRQIADPCRKRAGQFVIIQPQRLQGCQILQFCGKRAAQVIRRQVQRRDAPGGACHAMPTARSVIHQPTRAVCPIHAVRREK